MPVYNVSFLNPKMRPKKDYGFLNDILSIMQNQLESNGYNAPGDFKTLADKARQLRNNPGLSAEQRNNLDVKISDYESKASVANIKELTDLTEMNNAVIDDFNSTNLSLSNFPEVLISARIRSLSMKVNNLQSAMEIMKASGNQNSYLPYSLEYSKTLQQLNDYAEAADYMKNYNSGAEPLRGLMANIRTNAKGEILDVDISREKKSGFIQSDGLYKGIKIYGNTQDDNGRKVFKIGNEIFTENVGGFDPATGQTIESFLSRTGSYNPYGSSTGPEYMDVDLNQVHPQQVIPTGMWGKGSKFWYRANSDGTYEKHILADKDKFDIPDTNYINLDSNYDAALNQLTKNTFMPEGYSDPSIPMGAYDVQPNPNPQPVTPITGAGFTPVPAGGGYSPPSTSRTKSPISRAPTSGSGLAGQTIEKAKSFLSNLFK